MTSAFSSNLFREVRPDFFRVLAGPLARLYVDALDALEREASQRNQGIDRSEALALLEQVVEQHEDLIGADDDGHGRYEQSRAGACGAGHVARGRLVAGGGTFGLAAARVF